MATEGALALFRARQYSSGTDLALLVLNGLTAANAPYTQDTRGQCPHMGTILTPFEPGLTRTRSQGRLHCRASGSPGHGIPGEGAAAAQVYERRDQVRPPTQMRARAPALPPSADRHPALTTNDRTLAGGPARPALAAVATPSCATSPA